jgi:hypothetical protein
MNKCPKCQEMKLKISTIQVGEGQKKLITIGDCRRCGYHTEPDQKKWRSLS